MSRKLPEELVPVLAKLDHHWPEADEDGLRRAAGLWRDFGTEAEQLGRRGGASAQRVTGENSGGAVDAFADHWRAFSGDGRGYLDDAHTAAETVAKAFDAAADATDHCKAGIISVLTEVADEIKSAQAIEDKAKSALGGGILGTAAKAVTTVVVGGGELVAIEAAKLRVGGLLDELEHEMKQGLQTALKEPAITALERMAPGGAQGRSARSDLRALSGPGGGQFTGALAGGVAGGAAVAGVRMLSAKLGPDGRVVTDAAGNPVLVDQNGKTVAGVDGITVERDKHGRPIVGPDGTVSVVGADGMPVVGLAVGANGKPLTDATGQPLLVGADGTVAGSGLTLAFGTDGKPLTDAHGRPELLGPDGQPVPQADQPGVKYGRDGKPLTTVALNSVDLGTTGLGSTGLGSTDPNAVGLQSSVGVKLGTGGPATGAAPVTVTMAGSGGGFGGQVSTGPGPVTPADDVTPPQHAGGGGGGYRRQEPPPSYATPPSYDSTPVAEPGPVQLGPVTVRTDSVAVAPPPAAPVAGDPVGWGGSGGSGDGGSGGGGFGGGPQRIDPPISGVPLGGGGPVSGAPVAVGPVAGSGPVGGPPVGGPVAPPVGGPVGAPGGGVAVGPVAPGAAGGPLGGQPGSVGAPGAPGVAGQIGVVGGTGTGLPVQDARQPIGGARTPAGLAVTPGAGGGTGQAGAAPFRMFAETGPDLRRRPDAFGYAEGQPTGAWAAPVQPGQVAAAYLVAQSFGRPGVGPAVERPHVRTIADSRPYGHPGGLGPVDPAHQAEVESRLPRRTDLTSVPHPDPHVGDWPEALNGGGHREPGRSNNCVDIALSGLDTFAGRPTCSAPRLPDGPSGERGGRDRAERELGTHFRDLGAGDGALGLLAEALLHSGPGAQAVLLTLDEYGRSHTWNAVVHGAAVTFLDYQAGRQSAAPLYSADHGLWAIAVDAETRPLDLTGVQRTVPVIAVAEPEPEPEQVAEQPVAAPAPPRSRLTIHRTPASDSTRSKRR